MRTCRATLPAPLLLSAALLSLWPGPGRALRAQQEPGWYHVELEGEHSLTARLLQEDGDFYVFSFEGNVLRIAKSGVQSLKRLAEDGKPSTRAGSAMDRAPGTAVDPAENKEPLTKEEEALRNAIESLASTDDPSARRAYQFLHGRFREAHPFLHLSLGHQNARVRSLCLKLLGEKGKPEEDLEAVCGRLRDEKAPVRLAAAMAVRSLGPKGLPQLLEYLEREPVAANRKMAVKTFERWRDSRAVEPLVKLLGREEDSGVRNFISVALGSLTGRKLGSDHEAWTAYLAEKEDQKALQRMTESGNLQVEKKDGEADREERP